MNCVIVRNTVGGKHTYAEIRSKIYDVGGFSKVLISGPQGTVRFSSLHNGWYNTTVELSIWDVLNQYTVRLNAEDSAGNTLTYDYTVKGLFAGVLDFLKDIWDTLSGALSKAWDAVKSAVDWIVEWLKTTVAELFNAVIAPMIEVIKNWVVGINNAMIAFFEELAKWNVIDGNESVDNTVKAGLAFLLSFIGQQKAAESVLASLNQIMTLIKPFMNYISPFVGGSAEVIYEIAPILGVITFIFSVATLLDGNALLSFIIGILGGLVSLTGTLMAAIVEENYRVALINVALMVLNAVFGVCIPAVSLIEGG